MESAICPNCGIESFLSSGTTSCCHVSPEIPNFDTIKIEIDMVGAKRKRPSKSEQERILSEQGYACFYCERPFSTGLTLNRKGRVVVDCIHWDHIIPFVFNGNNDGFVAACPMCNLRKSDKIFNTLDDAKTYLGLKRIL